MTDPGLALAQWILNGPEPGKQRKGVFAFGQTAPRVSTGNAGLWFERFGTGWATKRSRGPRLGPDAVGWAKSLWDTGDSFGPVGDADEIHRYNERLCKLTQARKGTVWTLKLDDHSDFVTGLGIAHPVENGFAWHRTLGTPYLPGSGVKGLTHAWALTWVMADKLDIERIFGTASDTGDAGPARGDAGSVVFMDAVPAQVPILAARVLTPHGPGNGPPQERAPAQPIGYLAVRPGALFTFAVMPRGAPTPAGLADVAMAVEWLGDALSAIGAGARTKSGFGRFSAPNPRAQSAS